MNLSKDGVISVAIFTTDEFDATTVDASTIEFAGASAIHWAIEDVDEDGDQDMIVHFNVYDTDLLDAYETLILADLSDDGRADKHQEYEAILSGETTDGTTIEGSDVLDLFLSGKKFREFLNALP